MCTLYGSADLSYNIKRVNAFTGLTVGLSLMIIVVIIVLAAVVYTPPGAAARCLRRNRSEEHLSLTANRIS